MAQDIMYYFDNITYERKELGEIQTNFNFNLVIDGTKDSEQIDIYSFQRDALRPNTILYHNSTQTWWVVRKDQVKRNASEQGYWYQHSITLNGAIDLLNSRDLTDCGMNANDYTIDTFFKKLLKLSTFEFDYQINYGNNVDKDKKTDYIKSYENYTLLSAIRDFFNGYNCEVKMTFATKTENNKIYLDYAIFTIIPRTGNIDLEPISIDVFDDIRENINFDKESYGTTVISNAQNVVSTETKTFPQVGGVKVTGSDYDTNIDGAYIKLPSPAWKINWVKASSPSRATMTLQYRTAGGDLIQINVVSGTHYIYETEKFYNELLNGARNTQGFGQQDIEKIIENKDKIIEFCKMFSVSFYNNPTYNPRVNVPADTNNGSFIKEEETPYIPLLGTALKGHQVALVDKESASLIKNPKCVIVWERGSDKITNLSGILNNQVLSGLDTQLISQNNLIGFIVAENRTITIRMTNATSTQPATPSGLPYLLIGDVVFQVNYIPMSDLKIKQDNENNTKDSKLYNQNGKLNDSVALSKMVDSYSKEIINPTITRYMEYDNFNDIPKVGQIVMDGTTKYVINNISYNVYPNESNDSSVVGYHFECEFTLAMYVSTKSIMTSPNTNVRDYGIPQKYNIKRRQTYRDYYELDFNVEPLANQDTPYAKLENYLTFETQYQKKDYDHTALIKIDYANEVSGQLSWYYQLNSTTYVMNKSVYEIIDFNDNNIIGYDIQNSTTGFNMSDLWSSQYRAVTTPVSYVDDEGQFVGITLQMTNAKTLASAYAQVDTQGESVMLSAHCFINDTLYNLVANPQTQKNSDLITQQGRMRRNIGGVGAYYEFSVNSVDIGIPSEITLDQQHILGLVDSTITLNGQSLDPTSAGVSLQITNINNIVRTIRIRLTVFLASAGDSVEINTKVQYLDDIPLSDYVINEQDYNKDAIEVPVFEYSLQIGDTKDVEVGDEILKQHDCLIQMMCCVITSDMVTTLNEGIYQRNFAIIGGAYDSVDNNRKYRIVSDTYPLITLEDNNTKMRIKFYNFQEVEIIGNQDQTSFSYSRVITPTNITPQISKNALIGKDIIIRKAMINGVIHNDDTNDNELLLDRLTTMFIIHKPTIDQFDGNDLVLCLNHYRLK